MIENRLRSYGLVLLRFNTGLTALLYMSIITVFLGLKGVAVQMAVLVLRRSNPHVGRWVRVVAGR